MIVRNTKQTLLATSEIERTTSKVERVQQKAIFLLLFFSEVLKTDNMNTEDLLQQNTTHTSLSLDYGQTPNMVLERETTAWVGVCSTIRER
jgi:hypothetical protein